MTAGLRFKVSKPISRLAKTGVLSPEEVRAAIAIEDAVISILTHDVRSGFAGERAMRGRCAAGQAEDRLLKSCAVRQLYFSWVEAMQAACLPAGPVLDVIIDGAPLTQIDRHWKKRKGWSRGILKSGLGLYLGVEAGREALAGRLTA